MRVSSTPCLKSQPVLLEPVGVRHCLAWKNKQVNTDTGFFHRFAPGPPRRRTLIFFSVLYRSEASVEKYRAESEEKINASCWGRAEAPGDTGQVRLDHTLSFSFLADWHDERPKLSSRPSPLWSHGDVVRQVSSNESELRAVARGLTLMALRVRAIKKIYNFFLTKNKQTLYLSKYGFKSWNWIDWL